MAETNLSWDEAQPQLHQGKRVRRASWTAGVYLDLKAGKYRSFMEERKKGTVMVTSDWTANPDAQAAMDWEIYKPLFYSADS